MTVTRPWTAYLALVLGACAIAFAPIFVRLSDAGPTASGFWRLLLSLPLLALLTAAGGRGEELRSSNRAALIAGVLIGFDLACWHYGIRMTSVTNATVLANLSPVFVTIAAWLFFKEKPARMFLAGLALAMIGAWAMAIGRGASAPGSNPPLGDFLSAATSGWYAGYFLAVRAARRRMTAFAVMFWSSLVGAAVMLVVALAMGEQIMPITALGWGACIGLAAVHVVGQGAIAWALGRLPTATASVVVLIQPALAALLGWLIFKEVLNPLQGLGGALALTGVAIAQWASARKQAA